MRGNPESEPRRDRDPRKLYDEALKRILGETYETELTELLRQRRFVTDARLPQLFLPPQRHKGSDALYLYDFYQENDRILVPIMWPYKRTTQHFHIEPIFETYEVLRGELYLNGVLIPPGGQRVHPGEFHQTETRGRHALTLIVMKDARLVPEAQQHASI
ncbi:MAG: hypothetical protein HY427_02775 [Candidatus Levybacteria bacterium]|nr:hypothetical protein [Candidatus Levybacteria bacterium]